MNKTLVTIVIFAIISVGGIIVYLAMHSKNAQNGVASGSALTSNSATIVACDVLTEPIAQDIIGSSVKNISTSPVISEDSSMAVSLCDYIDTGRVDNKSASLLLRNAKTSVGADANKSQFDSMIPNSAQKVDKLGVEAYYTPSLKQLNILSKKNNWYVLSLHSFKDDNFGNLSSEKALAAKMKIE